MAIVLDALTVRFPETGCDGHGPAVSGLSLTCAPGEIVLLAGSTGCGKSTALAAVSGVIPHAVRAEVSGRVSVFGVDPARVALEKTGRVAGHLFQNVETQLFADRVGDEVMLPLEFGAVPAVTEYADARMRAGAELARYGLSDRAEERSAALSSGLKQRLALAALHLGEKKALLLDEPFAFLDADSAQALLRTLSGLARAGLAILIAEHREELVAPIATRVVRMGEASALRPFAISTPRGGESAGSVLLRAENLGFAYGAREVLADVNLALRAGDLAVLTGDNGSGKTTLCALLAGALAPGGGRVAVPEASGKFSEDREISRLPGRQRAAHVALALQNPDRQLFAPSVLDELPPDSARGALEDLGLWACRDKHPRALSFGQKRRLVVARLLARSPKILIVDEPSVGQDAANLAALLDRLESYRANGGALLLTTHDPRVIDALGQTIGQIIGQTHRSRCLRIEDGRLREDS